MTDSLILAALGKMAEQIQYDATQGFRMTDAALLSTPWLVEFDTRRYNA